MKRVGHIEVTQADVETAARCAIKGHTLKKEVRMFKEHFDDNVKALFDAYTDGTWRTRLSYRSLVKTNSNGKKRDILSPSFETRVYQWLSLNKLRPLYERKDNGLALNCKEGCGIQGAKPKMKHGEVIEHWSKRKARKVRRCSVLRRLKHIFYDRREYEYCVLIDQRKCYDHITEKVYRKALKNITTDRAFIEFSIGVTFVDGVFPVGTPTSPTGHHIIMLPFDQWLREECPDAVRYADNIFAPTRTREEAHALKWRIQNMWWYALGIRAKRHEVRVHPLASPLDFCGYVFHRHGREVCDHDKGYTAVRRSICDNAAKSGNDKSWASYFGLLQHADTFALMRRIERDMKLSQLTEKIRIDRSLDAQNIDIKAVVGQTISIRDYDIRKDAKGNPNWIKCLIGIEETDALGEPTGKVLAYEFHGGFQYIIEFITACEKAFTKEKLLPIEDVVIENQCGYIFKESTNQLKYIAV